MGQTLDIPLAPDVVKASAEVAGRYECPACGAEYDAEPYPDVPDLVKLFDPDDHSDPRPMLGTAYAGDMDCMTLRCHGRLRRGESLSRQASRELRGTAADSEIIAMLRRQYSQVQAGL